MLEHRYSERFTHYFEEAAHLLTQLKNKLVEIDEQTPDGDDIAACASCDLDFMMTTALTDLAMGDCVTRGAWGPLIDSVDEAAEATRAHQARVQGLLDNYAKLRLAAKRRLDEQCPHSKI